MFTCDTLIRNAKVLDGSGADAQLLDVGITNGRITHLGSASAIDAAIVHDARELTLAPGFIDAHTHDDIAAIRNPQMLSKLSQGVTTVIVGNCGISASPVALRDDTPDPMNLLGKARDFQYPTLADYARAVEAANPAVNVAALVGHTALRANNMDRLDHEASSGEVAAMRAQLKAALDDGALGLSTGLAYYNASAATTGEITALAELLAHAGGVYTTHMRSEFASILDAMEEAFEVGRSCGVPVIISHLKCAGPDNWGRSAEVLAALEAARVSRQVACDCYPYAAGSSTLDLGQVDERITITITWSTPHPELGGQTLGEIATRWNLPQVEAARRLQPAGAIYHSISEDDMRRILCHPATMIGSDGLPNDPRPHPRLWGTFPRVLGRYCREQKLLTLPDAIHKMTGLPAGRFGLAGRGFVRPGFYADLVLFDSERILDTATWSEPTRPAEGINAVWVNGILSYAEQNSTGNRAGHFLPRGRIAWMQ